MSSQTATVPARLVAAILRERRGGTASTLYVGSLSVRVPGTADDDGPSWLEPSSPKPIPNRVSGHLGELQ